jgi:hypothetical protein
MSRRGAGDDHRAHELAVFAALPLGDHPCALVERIGEVGRDLLDRGLVDQRADCRSRREARRHVERGNLCAEPGEELFLDGSVDEDTVGTDAGLPGIAELAGHGRFHRHVEICVLEHDQRRVAAQFEAQPLDRVGTLAHQQRTDAG